MAMIEKEIPLQNGILKLILMLVRWSLESPSEVLVLFRIFFQNKNCLQPRSMTLEGEKSEPMFPTSVG